jgi:CRP-like cAMP-binding protein
MQGLRLLSFEPGDIIISEGDAGDSLFVIASGIAKAFVRKDGRQTLARSMDEGTFFGEISILSGKPRTATVTAATPCELLELDRATLDGITKAQPNVRQVLEDFYVQRAGG